MAKKPLPTPEELRQRLRYEPETGKLFWLARGVPQWDGKYEGREAFTYVSTSGYKQGAVHNRLLYAHRVIWAMTAGEWPEGDIDHVNRHRTDNRLANLREATRSQNMNNSGIRSNNKSGFKGVFWEKKGRVWVAQIKRGRKTQTLGRFSDKRDAGEAYRKAASILHGEFFSGL